MMPYILQVDKLNGIISIVDKRTDECIISGELKHNFKSIVRIQDMLQAANLHIHITKTDEK